MTGIAIGEPIAVCRFASAGFPAAARRRPGARAAASRDRPRRARREIRDNTPPDA